MSVAANENLTHACFSGCVGEAFRLSPPTDQAEPFDVELVSVRALAKTDLTPREQPFAIEFRGPGDKPLSQGTWRIEHPTMGVADVFLVPVGPDERGLRYEAVFN